jgi:hypothetical protein
MGWACRSLRAKEECVENFRRKDRRIILSYILIEIEWGCVDWIDLA